MHSGLSFFFFSFPHLLHFPPGFFYLFLVLSIFWTTSFICSWIFNGSFLFGLHGPLLCASFCHSFLSHVTIIIFSYVVTTFSHYFLFSCWTLLSTLCHTYLLLFLLFYYPLHTYPIILNSHYYCGHSDLPAINCYYYTYYHICDYYHSIAELL